MDILQKDLVPILINVKDQPCLFRSTVKLLVGLTVPVECLVSVETLSQSTASKHVLHELTQLLYNAKEAFLDPRATRAIIDHVNSLIEKQPLSTEECETVNDCMLLLRNLLHAPERPQITRHMDTNEAVTQRMDNSFSMASNSYLGSHPHGHGYVSQCPQQNRLLWNLFAQGLDRVLINLLACSQKEEWVVTIVQLVALFYKDQHVEHMQKLLGSWLDTTSSDSSEDDESNTSPQVGSCSPQVLTSSSDPTSDSSDSAARMEEKSVQELRVVGEEENSEPVDLKLNRKGLHKLSLSEAGPGGDTASCSSISHSSVLSDESWRISQHSGSSGFCSEASTNPGGSQQQQQKSTKERPPEIKDCKEKSKDSKRRCHINQTTSNSKNVQNRAAATKEEVAAAIATSTSSEDIEPSSKRAGKVLHTTKPGRSSASQEKEQRRKKLIKRSSSISCIKRKAIVHHTPSEEDISQLLKEFTVDFLLKGYNTLVSELHKQLFHQVSLPLDKSHFLWLITYFLRFASQLELDLKHLRSILTVDMLCYLTWEGVVETEQFEVASIQKTVDLKPYLRRLHLGVTAIREYLQALETYSRINHLSEEDREKINHLRRTLPAIKDLRQLFLLQIRHFNPLLQSRRYLRDCITGNHVLLLSLERAVQQSSCEGNFVLQEHMQQFCSRTVLAQYGLALEDFKTNGPFVNDCILTVLHHIGADLERPELLCEPIILRTFSKIWEEEFDMCDDWVDLIEYVVQKFLRNFHASGFDYESDSGRKSNSGDSVLSEHNVESQGEKLESNQNGEHPALDVFYEEVALHDIETLKGRLIESGFQQQLDWVQQLLLTICAVRLGIYDEKEYKEPIVCLSHSMNVPCPLVPWTDAQAAALRSELFLLFLHRMGLLPESNNGGIFPRIPREWDANTLYSAALILGPVSQECVEFELSQVNQVDLPIPNNVDDLPIGSNQNWLPPYLGPGPATSLSAMPHHWLHWVEQSGSLFRSAEKTSHGHSSHSNSNNSHRPMDSISTTSSLEVHKTDSSDDEEMEENPANIPPSCHVADMQNAYMEDENVWFSDLSVAMSSDELPDNTTACPQFE